MNLEDILTGSLEQDEWSRLKPRFGEDQQLEVIGWSGRTSSGNKYYILKCSHCAADEPLFGGGYFKSPKASLEKGSIPCSCSKRYNWTKEEFTILCARKAERQGCKFIGFIGRWEGHKTKIILHCKEHGEWASGIINTLLNMDQGCPHCTRGYYKSDEDMIASFLASKAFHPDTKFWRSDRKTKQGSLSYWYVSCPECGAQGESSGSNLQDGKRSCLCSRHRQQECYINFVIDHDVVAIKFGIANNSKNRVKQQNYKSIYKVCQYDVYRFADVISCKKAERDCKRELECGILSRQEMPDGWTETTWLYNLDKIIEIYERNGGIRIE